MKELVVQVLDKDYEFLVELLKKFDFVSIRETKKIKKEKELNAIRERLVSSFTQAKLIDEGKLEGRSAREFLAKLENE